MRPLPPAFQAALDTRTAFIPEVSLEASRLGAPPVSIEAESGRFTFDARRSIRGDGEIVVPTRTLPRRPQDLLTPFGTRITVRLGITLPAGVTATVAYGTYIVDASRAEVAPGAAAVTLPLLDLAQVAAGYRFETPFTTAPGTDLAQVVNAVITDRTGENPQLDPMGTVIGRRTFGLDPEDDPWHELVDLCRGFGFDLFYDRDGTLQLLQPMVAGLPRPIAPLKLTSAFERRPANVVVARGEPTDQTIAPVQAVAIDDDPASPTYAGTGPGTSPYGRITRYYASPQLETVGQAQSAATSILASELAAAASWTVSRAWDPTVEPYDILAVDDDAGPLQLLVDAVTANIGGETQIECRLV